jgi:hypothetical protein
MYLRFGRQPVTVWAKPGLTVACPQRETTKPKETAVQQSRNTIGWKVARDGVSAKVPQLEQGCGDR